MVTVIKTGVVEFMVLIVRLFATLMTAFIRHVFFFWPRKYKNITGDAILITGGGKGIGRVIAMEFAKRRPKQIIIWGQHEDSLSATAKAIQLQGVACEYMLCDVAEVQQVSVKWFELVDLRRLFEKIGKRPPPYEDRSALRVPPGVWAAFPPLPAGVIRAPPLTVRQPRSDPEVLRSVVADDGSPPPSHRDGRPGAALSGPGPGLGRAAWLPSGYRR